MKINKKDFNFNELVSPYLRKWPVFLICVLAMLSISFIYTKFKAPVFKVQTSILVKDAKKMSSNVGDMDILQGVPGFGGMGTNSIENELEILQSKTIIEDVVKDLRLQTPVYAKQTFYDVELYKDINPINVVLVRENVYAQKPKKPVRIEIKDNEVVLSSNELKEDIKTRYDRLVRLPYADIIITKNSNFNKKKAGKLKFDDVYFNYLEFDDAVENYQKAVSVDLLNKEATVIGINMTAINQDKAVDFLNTLVKKYNSYAVHDKNTESEKTKNFIDDRIAIISKELGNVESEKQNFKVKNQIVDVQSDARINLEINQEAKKRKLELDTQIELNSMLYNYLNGSSSYQLVPANVGVQNPVAIAGINNLNILVQQRNKLLENATPANPLIKDLEMQISNLRQNIKESLLKDRGALQISRNSISGQEVKSSQSITTIPEKERIFRNIERQQQIKENLFLILLQKREEAAISMAITSNKARVIDSAYAIKKPVAPKKLFILAGGLLIGLLLPAIYVLIKELFNDKIIIKSDVEKLSDIPVIAEIPRTLKKSDQLLKTNDLSPLAESFRILVTNLRFVLRKNENAKIIMVTSSMKGEGKTFISVNLALALTTPKKKVLVIGSDIRNPQLQRYNPSMKVAQGLTEFLNSDINNVDEIIHPSGFISGTDFIYSGIIPPNPTDLLQNDRYELLLKEVKDKYDYIILDTAPLMPVTDSFLIAHLADATVYVVRSEVSLKAYMEFANNHVKNNNLKNLVFVVNDIKKANFAYGNQYGYSNEEKKKWWFK